MTGLLIGTAIDKTQNVLLTSQLIFESAQPTSEDCKAKQKHLCLQTQPCVPATHLYRLCLYYNLYMRVYNDVVLTVLGAHWARVGWNNKAYLVSRCSYRRRFPSWSTQHSQTEMWVRGAATLRKNWARAVRLLTDWVTETPHTRTLHAHAHRLRTCARLWPSAREVPHRKHPINTP